MQLGHCAQNHAACRNAAGNVLRLNVANGIASTLRHYSG